MEEIKVFRKGDLNKIESDLLPGSSDKGEGWIKRIIYPNKVNTKSVLFGIGEINPGYPYHRWHTHKSHKLEGYEVIYPENFEEVYYIVSGSGVIQYKTADGKVKEEKVSAGDTIFFPVGVAEHQLFNNGTEKMLLVFSGAPVAGLKVTLKK
jgi:oxalate decarboxylase/phosphoglucose isomerase-like protein (cupin superfamily)